MKVIIDDITYNVDMTKPIQFYKILYAMARGEGLKLPNGQIFQMGSQSLIRTALKMIITPIILPLIKAMYYEQGIELTPPVKHADLIDYCVTAMLDYCIITQEQFHVNLTSEASSDSSRTVVAIAATWQSSHEEARQPGVIDSPSPSNN